MREILFRGKRIDGGEWIEGYYLRDVLTMPDYLTHFIATPWGFSVRMFEVYPRTVGQFTGLTDKNGKRIFEGDIVKAPFCGRKLHIFTVQYLCDGFYAVPADHDDNRLWKYRMECEHQNMRIIGNIHDNPELMEVE